MESGSLQFSIGRSVNCDVVLADESVAPRHAELEIVPDGPLIISDSGSGLTTCVVHRGQRRAVRKAIVSIDDALQVGDVEIPVSELLVAIQLRHPEVEWGEKRPPPRDGGADAAQAPPAPGPVADKPAPLVAPKPASAPVTRSLMLPCPTCQKATSSLKRLRLFKLLVFLGFAWWSQRADYTACPGCLRGIIVKRTLINLPSANLAWPIVFLVHAVQFGRTFPKGHSKKIRELLKG